MVVVSRDEVRRHLLLLLWWWLLNGEGGCDGVEEGRGATSASAELGT